MAFPVFIEKFLSLKAVVDSSQESIAEAVSKAEEAKTAADTAFDSAAAKAPAVHTASSAEYGAGANGVYGHVRLLASTSSVLGETGGTAATPSAVKAAYDLAQSAADSAENCLPLSGGTMTGNIDMGGRNVSGVGRIQFADGSALWIE